MEPSYIPIYANNDPAYYNDGLADFNPLAIIDSDLTGYWEEKNKRYETTFSLVYDLPFVKGLQLKGLVAYDARARTRKMMRKFYNEYKFINNEYKPTGVNAPSNLAMDNQQQYFLTSQVSLNYKTTISGNHNVSGLLLGELRQTNGTFFSGQKNFVLDVLDQLNAGLTENAVATGSDQVPLKNTGLVGRINYEYGTKYLAEVSFRYDGSSLFPSDSRWGFFPAFSVGWRMSEESFIKDNLASVSNLKLRLSHGTMGDDAAANGFEYLEGYFYPSGSYMFSSSGLVTGATSRGLANPNITWYTATTSNIGFDVDIRQSLFFASFDLFRRERNGLLATRATALPSEFGATFPQENLNSDLSTGYEIVVGHKGKIGNDLIYEVSANLTYARTKWLYREVAPYGSTYQKWRNDLSNRWSNMRWGYGYEGQFQTQEELNTAPAQNGNGHAGYFPGDMRYEDWNGDGMISGLDQRPIGRDNNAEIFYGLDMNTIYKGFALTLFWQGATHYTLFPTAQMRGPLMWGRNSIDIFMDRWHHEDPLDFSTPWVPGKFPISRTNFGFAPNQEPSEYMFQDIWYLRLKNVELSYTLPIKWSKKVFIQDLRIFTNATNLLTFKSKEAYFDPEKRLDGDEAENGYKYPVMKNYNLGIDITF
jgi:TonB-linked SusC/RagA family outer membrane protein